MQVAQSIALETIYRLSEQALSYHEIWSLSAMNVRIIAIVVLSVVWGASAQAGFKSTFSEWKQTSPFAQAQYATGLLDGQLLPSIDDKSEFAMSVGLNECAFDLQLTGSIIADAITRHYEDHSDMWGMPPLAIFHEVIVKGACLQHINTERAKYELGPW
jgi:hypothetical protein